MAATIDKGNGRFEIQFKSADGLRRPVIRLGKCTRTYAEGICAKVERLVACQILGIPPDVELAVWVNQLKPKLHKRFSKAGLATERPPLTVAELCTYCRNHFGGKRGTQLNYGHTEHNLITFFGANRAIHEITRGDAREFRKWLETSGKRRYTKHTTALAPTTLTKRCKVSKQFFEFAVEKRWIAENPFAGMRGWHDTNQDREFFIDGEMAQTLIDAARDPQMKLLIAFVRYAGLRCPSEIKLLRWEWVDWESDQIKVHSPKTEHHQHGKYRTIPIFARLRPYLLTAAENRTDSPLIFTFEATGTALAHRLYRLCKRADIERWPKIWHNLRSSLETELAEQGFSLIAITRWLGNSPTVAKKHYLQVTKEQHARAVQGGELRLSPPAKSAAKSAASPAGTESNNTTGV